MPKPRPSKASAQRQRTPAIAASQPEAAAAAPARGRPRASKDAGDELGAAELARRVADSLKAFRRKRDLSLDELSLKSGVSRAALSQIEGGRTNPTLTVLWKIAVGLEIPFHELLGGPLEESVLVLRAGSSPPLRSGDRS